MPPKAHAILSASSSHRWLNCPPSARLCETYEDKGSDYAAEGTDAHSLCEYKLRTALGMEATDPTELVDLQAEINHDIDELVDLKKEISYTIKAVPSPELQTLLEKRYLCFQSWEIIAVDMGYSMHHLYKIHNQALDICDGILKRDT